MINSISTIPTTDLMDTVRRIAQTSQAMTTGEVGSTDAAGEVKGAPSFGEMLSSLVKSVDQKSKVADSEVQAVMTGKSNNIHQAMLSMQEAGVAFTMMTEVRNKLVTAYQELMRMQV